MLSLLALLSRIRSALGAEGASDNARRSLEEHRLTMLRVDALARRMAEAGHARSPGRDRPAATPRRRASA